MKEKFNLNQNHDKPYVLKFEAEWCMPCKMMKPIVNELDDTYNSQVDFYSIDTEADYLLVDYFGIQGVPTLIFVKEGKEVSRITGATNKNKITDEIKKIL